MSAVHRLMGFIALFAFWGLQFVAGVVGIEQSLGSGWAWAALGFTLLFRATAPMSVAAFFGATDVWGWHWALAAIFSAIGLAFALPGAMMTTVRLFKR